MSRGNTVINPIVLELPLGTLAIEEQDGFIAAVTWYSRGAKQPTDAFFSPLLKSAARQIEEYSQGRRRMFDLPLKPRGTEFQESVWRVITKIPFGKTRSYGSLAQELGTAARAVGAAAGKNPLPIFIPCHRVVGKQGALGGFSGGDGVATKRQLLRLEGHAAF
ncbi:MAG: methylated-DNA--[protein]-cysteine S-methyltransferase [Alphaproteobacteria bacterium]|nr:methylated-DNA--[protein]-cysteine S-methyltransferase [Alphaproteobacteria bacterium]MDP7122895.1 methylated-DNA--[protein]-cysteine S-methyltransferase [Alphaproteobacteria bacterium]MDP7310954.1 methylated-DNA--[protein]-cysteine S-methyltransferase [Alphaproteobacteria bacterium]MDP7468130.1 methylated-DNA--[protein]-cysteine S-methyltransferase [Alphaproteobacteria bacterium]MDP7543364.1 methylated-DNA--[protein]-cysteine S-methyltransferase [Alphaproteobacteria bacterium]